MLNRTAIEMASRSIDLINKKINKSARAGHLFFLISKRTNLHAFLSFFAFVLQDYNTILCD